MQNDMRLGVKKVFVLREKLGHMPHSHTQTHRQALAIDFSTTHEPHLLKCNGFDVYGTCTRSYMGHEKRNIDQYK